jgi:hypothetical protein
MYPMLEVDNYLKLDSPCLDFHTYPMLEVDNYLKLDSPCLDFHMYPMLEVDNYLKLDSPCLDFHMYPMLEVDNYLKLGSRRYNSQVFDLGVCKSSETRLPTQWLQGNRHWGVSNLELCGPLHDSQVQ